MWGKLFGMGILGAGGITIVRGLHNPDSELYPRVVMPLARKLDPETAHNLALWAARMGLFPLDLQKDDPVLKQTCWGKQFSNPVGLAAGFDKNAEAIEGLSKMGLGFIEIGSVTPLPQPGNPKPRVFRLIEDGAVINRYGFNSEGHDVVAQRLSQMRTNKIVGVNLGKNKTSEDAIGDYTKGAETLGEFADYLVINVSSPNTPNLRDLQSEESLSLLYKSVAEARDKACAALNRNVPVLIKVAPDLTELQKQSIADLALQLNVDGIIISNTTSKHIHDTHLTALVTRPNLKSPLYTETGGLSGRPLKELSTEGLRDIYERTKGKIPLIGVGGIFTGQDALDKIEAGASLVQLYSAIALEGPGKVHAIKRELRDLLKEKGYSSVSEAVGKSTKVHTESVLQEALEKQLGSE